MAISTASTLNAADFEYRELGLPANDYGQVPAEIFMTGPVTVGDAERLTQEFKNHLDYSHRLLRLRLNSPGGSLEAALELERTVYELGLQTYVGTDDQCLSACAIVFMSGTLNDGDDTKEPARSMHHMSKIGFHAPFAFNKDKAVPDEARKLLLSQAEQEAHRAGASLMRLAVEGRLPPDLVEELLLVDQDDFLFVDTVDRAARWGITIENAKLIPILHHDRLESYCTNAFAWENSIAFENRGGSYDVSLMSLDDGSRLGTAMMEFSCELTLQEHWDTKLMAAAMQGAGFVRAWQSLPGDTRINTLGPEEVDGATGPTWNVRFPAPKASDVVIDYAAIQEVSGRCKNNLVWQGGWTGEWKPDMSYEVDATRSYALVAVCGGGFGPFSIDCNHGESQLLVRFAYADTQRPNTDGKVLVDIDGQVLQFQGENGDVYGHEQIYVRLDPDHRILDLLKRGSQLRFVGDGPNQTIHLSGSRRAIEAMELSCR